MSVVRDFINLLFPPQCPACGGALAAGSGFLCTACHVDMPLTYTWLEKQNHVADRFAGHIPVVTASSMYYFIHDGKFRSLIHSFKYSGNWTYAQRLGEMYGVMLAESGNYDDIDLVIPVPLHSLKLIRRGYNQAEYIARGICRSLGAKLDRSAVARRVYNKSQTKHRGSERWDNVEGIFAVRRPHRLAGRHILLVDDVLTTGATIISCAEAILKRVPDCRISVVTLAVSRREIPLRKVVREQS